jgi:hypothetical protein
LIVSVGTVGCARPVEEGQHLDGTLLNVRLKVTTSLRVLGTQLLIDSMSLTSTRIPSFQFRSRYAATIRCWNPPGHLDLGVSVGRHECLQAAPVACR